MLLDESAIKDVAADDLEASVLYPRLEHFLHLSVLLDIGVGFITRVPDARIRAVAGHERFNVTCFDGPEKPVRKLVNLLSSKTS